MTRKTKRTGAFSVEPAARALDSQVARLVFGREVNEHAMQATDPEPGWEGWSGWVRVADYSTQMDSALRVVAAMQHVYGPVTMIAQDNLYDVRVLDRRVVSDSLAKAVCEMAVALFGRVPA